MEIEDEWAKEKAARQAVEQVHAPKPSRRWIWAVVAAVLVVGGLITAGVIVQMHAKPRITRPDVPAGTVEVEVRSKHKAFITVDGHKIGRAPQAIHVPKAATPLHVTDGRTTKLVVPDHDQTVDFD
jgi:hypothetical protein